MSQVADPWGGTTTYRYDLDGEPLRTTFGNGAIEDRTYDARGRITSVVQLTGGGVPQDDFIYAYQGAGGGSTERIASENSTLQGSRSDYYDSLGRLVGESLTSPSETIGYQYDAMGNRQTKTTNGAIDFYGYANERLAWMNEGTSAAPVSGQTAPYETFAYDADGRLSSRVRQYPGGLVRSYAFGWDEADQLTSVTDSGMNPVFTASYDGEGLRQSQWDEWTGEHDYAWGSGEVVSDSSQSSTYVPGVGQKVGGATSYFHTDPLGRVRYLSNASGTFANGVGYDAYGNEVSESGSSVWQPSAFLYGGGLGYQSEYASQTEPGLGLDYLQQRYYDPAVGRFISPDPIGIAGGLNSYAYVEDDPVNGVDPSGLGPSDSDDPGDEAGYDLSQEVRRVHNQDVYVGSKLTSAAGNAYIIAATSTTGGSLVLSLSEAANRRYGSAFLAGLPFIGRLFAGTAGKVIRNALEAHELGFANEIADFFGGEYVGNLRRGEPGIDGRLNGCPVSLKQYTGKSPLGVLTNASDAEKEARRAGYRGVELYIQAKGINSTTLLDFANKGPLVNIPNQGTIKAINVLTANGWVRFIGH